MKLSTWILAGLLLAGAVGGFVAWRRATEPSRAWAEFLELDGVELAQASAVRRERARSLFERFAPLSLDHPQTLPWMPWALLRSGSSEDVMALWMRAQGTAFIQVVKVASHAGQVTGTTQGAFYPRWNPATAADVDRN